MANFEEPVILTADDFARIEASLLYHFDSNFELAAEHEKNLALVEKLNRFKEMVVKAQAGSNG